jgi:type IV pilus assembly protein PilY1
MNEAGMNQAGNGSPRLTALALALGALGVAPAALPQALTIATDPLGTATTSIKPNIMFILDNSGSMDFDYMPDWINDSHSPTSSTASCFDSGDSSTSTTTDFDDAAGSIAGNPDACQVGDPPFMSPDLNTIYYNPAIQYSPALNYDGTSRGSQDAANTSNWTSVRTDSYNVSNRDQLGNTTNFVDITNSYPDRVWCTSTADAAGGGNCRRNASYDYPNFQFPYGRTGTPGSIKYVGSNPYYYRMQSAQYCNPAGTSCASGDTIAGNLALYTTRFPEYCTDSELTNCAAGTAVTAAHTFSGPRWCSDATTLATCQRKKIGNFIYAKHLGRTASQTGAFPAVANAGQITVTDVNVNGGTITNITIGGTTVFSGSLAVPAGSTPSNAAAILTAAIDPHASYNATQSGAGVVVTQQTAGSAGSGDTITITASTVPSAASFGSVTIGSLSSTLRTITAVNVNGTNLLCAIGADASYGNGVTAKAANGRIEASSGFSNSSRRNSVRDAIIDRINACTGSNGGYTAYASLSAGSNPVTNPASQSSATGKVYIVAPLAQGATPNGYTVALSGTSITGGNPAMATVNLTGGAVGPSIATTTVSMSGGADAFTGTRTIRIGVGAFTRTDVVPGNNSYPKSAARTDCLSSTCSYAEEMTNFANWYTYYRNRLRMMKSSAGRAFVNVPDTFRVGFITINPGSPVSSSRYLKIADFATGSGNQKDLWYSKFYSQSTSGSTPLREALSRVGWIYAGKLDTGLTYGIPVADDPVTASCQPNFAILSTDGYWNGNGGQLLDGSTMNNQDGDISTSPRPIYDGSQTTTTDVTVTKTYTLGALGANGCSAAQRRILLATKTDTRTRTYSGTTASGSPISDTTASNTVNSNYTGCSASGGTMPSPNPQVTNNPQTTASAGGASNTLADVASYYYKTDLRTPTGMSWAPNGTGFAAGLSDNNVPITNKDGNSAQHMVTFTLGLGLDGTLTYRSDYETATSGDYYNILQGSANWPAPTADAPTALDDLWHAGVAGRGVFFSARDPQTLTNSLVDTLAALQTRVGAGAAAATSNLQPVAGDNFAFTAQYQTSDWVGDLKARTIDLTQGIVSAVQLWSAGSILDGTAHTQRKIFTYDATDTGGNLLKHFCMPTDVGASWCNDGTGLTATEQANFVPTGLAQYPYGGNAARIASVSTDKVVNFVRGDNTYEDTGQGIASDLFRQRISLLGDIVNAQPAYVRKSPFSYEDAGFADFKKCADGIGSGCAAAQFPDPSNPRRGTVFAAANDGMLHAFETDVNNNPYYQTAGITTAVTADDTFTGNNTGNGVERWAYIPGIVQGNLRRLANIPYSHRYNVDGSPTVGDVCIGAACTAGTATKDNWRTVLVGGLNSGGLGYYALDITNPVAPKALWEFTNRAICYTDAQISAGGKYSDCNVGLSFGNAIITKRPLDGKWVAIVSSGYNNNVSGGDGKGYVYVLDVGTGEILQRLNTGFGSAASPSGLARINGFTQNGAINNTTLAVYGGDLSGNMWRFQLDNTATDYLAVTKLAQAKDASNVAQPITVRPEIALVGTRRVILFGTGKFLEDGDKTSTTAQSIYALADNLSITTSPVIADVRGGTVKARVFGAATDAGGNTVADTRTIVTGAAPSWGTDEGWRIDLPESGERVNVDPQVQLGTLVVASNVPSGGTCVAGGFSFINFLDVATGSFVPGATNNMASTKIASSLTVGINVIQLPGGAVKTIATTADNQQLSKDTPVPSTVFGGRRISWRELIRE